MLDLSKAKWKLIDKSTEEFETDTVRIVRSIDDEYIPIDCPICQNLFNSSDDVDAYKRHKMCKTCELDKWSELYNK
jgi:hypothetical protein